METLLGCSICKESADKCVQFTARRYWVLCDSCIESMRIGIYASNSNYYECGVVVNDVFISLISTQYNSDPIFLYVMRKFEQELENAKKLFLSV